MNKPSPGEIFALDTSTVIDILRSGSGVVQRLAERLPQEIAVATMTLAELQLGVLNSSNPRFEQARINRLVGLTRILPFGRRAAMVHAHIKQQLRSNPIGPQDMIIAATVLANDATLVTSNTREFSRVPDLRIENWRADSDMG